MNWLGICEYTTSLISHDRRSTIHHIPSTIPPIIFNFYILSCALNHLSGTSLLLASR